MSLSEAEQLERRDALRTLMFATPYIEGLGISVDVWATEHVVLRLAWKHDLTNDGAAYHGGAVASLMDTAGAAAVWADHDFNKGARAATVSMTINYTGTARQSDLLATARCVKRGKDLAFSEIEVHDQAGKLIATGTLVYRIVP